MTGLISGISSQLPRRLALGTLLPVVVFVLAGQWAVAPLVPERWAVAELVATLEAEWQLALWTLATVLLTGLLYVLNIPLIRVYEGYPWKDSWIGKWCADRKKARETKLREELAYLGHLVRAVKARNAQDPRLAALRERRDGTHVELLEGFPKHASILPTRLGNVIRAFESYPFRQYRMAGIELWPRLVRHLDDKSLGAIDAAKTRFDFMLNGSILAAVVAVLALLTAVLTPASLDDGPGPRLLAAAVLLLLSILCYRSAIGRARSWGAEVKAAFDLHRRDLLKGLGFEQSPGSLAEERALWHEIGLQLRYLDGWDDRPPVLAFAPPAERAPSPGAPLVTAGKGGAKLELSRGVEMIDHFRTRVVLEVRNTGAEAAETIRVTDALEPGWDYAWEADVSPRPVLSRGALAFPIASLAAAESRTITYATLRRERSCCHERS